MFQIRPRPSPNPDTRRGSLAYDSGAGTFLISLNSNQGAAEPDTPFADTLTRVQRFAYAHEFVHRFLFISQADHWSRALTVVVEESPSEDRLGTTRFLSHLEEKICDVSAGRILVPEDALEACVADKAASWPSGDLLWTLIGDVARTFQVSWACAFRRLSKTKPHAVMASLGDSFCFLLVGSSRATGRGSGQPRIRLIDYWWPTTVGDTLVKDVYPGLPLRHLGEDLEEIVGGILARESPEAGDMRCVVLVKSKKNEDDKLIPGEFEGRWKRWGRASNAMVALYGTLRLT